MPQTDVLTLSFVLKQFNTMCMYLVRFCLYILIFTYVHSSDFSLHYHPTVKDVCSGKRLMSPYQELTFAAACGLFLFQKTLNPSAGSRTGRKWYSAV